MVGVGVGVGVCTRATSARIKVRKAAVSSDEKLTGSLTSHLSPLTVPPHPDRLLQLPQQQDPALNNAINQTLTKTLADAKQKRTKKSALSTPASRWASLLKKCETQVDSASAKSNELQQKLNNSKAASKRMNHAILASHEEYVDGLKQIIADALSQFDAKASSFVA